MQHILVDIKFNQLFLQCAEIVEQGEVKIINDREEIVLSQVLQRNNFLNIELRLPKGNYHLELHEGSQTWKRNFKL